MKCSITGLDTNKMFKGYPIHPDFLEEGKKLRGEIEIKDPKNKKNLRECIGILADAYYKKLKSGN